MPDIIIIEDGVNERERLEKLFVGAGFSIGSAESAAEAERLLELNDYRLAILDIGLGDKSGLCIFDRLKRLPHPPFVVIQTGNPSIHLKQRFLDEGAAGYVVKASAASSNEALLSLVQSLLGSSQRRTAENIPLAEFLRRYLPETSKELFLDEKMRMPRCKNCGSCSYQVTFSHKPQLPPLVEGKVICTGCFTEMDLEIA